MGSPSIRPTQRRHGYTWHPGTCRALEIGRPLCVLDEHIVVVLSAAARHRIHFHIFVFSMLCSPCVSALGQPACYVKPFHRPRMPVESNTPMAATASARIVAVQAAVPVTSYITRRPKSVFWELIDLNGRIKMREPGCCNQDQKQPRREQGHTTQQVERVQIAGGVRSSCMWPSSILMMSTTAAASTPAPELSWNLESLVPSQSARSVIYGTVR